MFQAVIFDVDGTLVDSNDAHATAWVHAIAESGRHVEFSRVRPLIGMGGDKLLPSVTGLSIESSEGKSIADRRRDAPDVFQVFAVVGGEAFGSHAAAYLGELRQRYARACGVPLERRRAIEGLQFCQPEVGEQRLAVRGAVQRHQLAGLTGDDDALVAGGIVIDEKDFASFTNGEMSGFSRPGRECLDRLMADADQHPAPVVFARQSPDGRTEHIMLPSVGVGEEATALQRICQTEDTARVDAEDVGQLR